jgi:hypothetical protein
MILPATSWTVDMGHDYFSPLYFCACHLIGFIVGEMNEYICFVALLKSK